jgi:hypothetical protein
MVQVFESISTSSKLLPELSVARTVEGNVNDCTLAYVRGRVEIIP